MARALRVHVPGVAVHVMSRGNNKQPIFLDSLDYGKYLELLPIMLRRFKVCCHAFCLLYNHLHLLITPRELPVSRLMQQLRSVLRRPFPSSTTSRWRGRWTRSTIATGTPG